MYIRSSRSTGYADTMTYSRSGHRFRVHINNCSEANPMCKFQVVEIHPYDDAGYVYAVCDGTQINYYRPLRENDFIRNAPHVKLIDSEAIVDYIPDEWESYNEYVDELIDSTCVNLLKYNAHIEPVIIHN